MEGILILLTIGMLAFIAYWLVKNRLAPIQSISAVVVRKRVIGADCYITFALSGHEREFVVSLETYQSLDEHQSGTLVFQGEIFREFVPDNK